MTKAAALFEWFNGFLPAYPASNVPKDVIFPYLTYELVLGAWGDEDIGITVNLWYYTESEAEPNAMADKMSKAIGRGGTYVECDGGAILIKRGNPWCQNVVDERDTNIKRRYINISLEYFTED